MHADLRGARYQREISPFGRDDYFGSCGNPGNFHRKQRSTNNAFAPLVAIIDGGI
jgi:hypothetical protein